MTPDRAMAFNLKHPGMLAARNVANPDGVCAMLRERLGHLDAGVADDAPESMFVRLASL